jgi:hypothetical protein
LDIRSRLEVGMGEVGVGVRDDDPERGEGLGASRPNKMNPRQANLRSRNLRAAVMPISSKNRQSAP